MTTSTQTQLRRGTSSQLAAMTPALGEAVVNTTTKTIHVGDGSTAGGNPLASQASVQASLAAIPTPKATVVFDASGTIAASFNVSGVTRNGTGDFTITFATPLSSANYPVIGMASDIDSAGFNAMTVGTSQSHPPTSSDCRITIRQDNGALADSSRVSVVFFA